jgi:hypothetical protein
MELLPAQNSQSVSEDEMLSLTQQLKEIECYRENGKGQYPAGTVVFAKRKLHFFIISEGYKEAIYTA